MKHCIGIDLGGTNIAVGVVNEAYQIVGEAKLKTNIPRPAEEVAADMIKAAGMAVENAGLTMADIEWVGIGTPGTVNAATGDLIYANNLYFRNVPLGRMIKEGLNKPVFVENDANSAAFGELLAGAAKGRHTAIMITLGTGVGGGIIIGGKIYSGYNYRGAEIGHIGMMYDGYPCTCGRKGCIESYCSATALIRITREAMQASPSSRMWALTEGDLSKANGRTSFAAMREGDAAGTAVVEQYISYLNYAISGLINIFQPEIFVIGGGISKEGEALLAPMRAYMEKNTYSYDSSEHTQFAIASLGNDAGIIGAAFLGR